MYQKFDTRNYNALSGAWWFIQKKKFQLEDHDRLKQVFEETFTIKNLCENYDLLSQHAGVGPKTLGLLREAAKEHRIEIKNAKLNNPHKHSIRIR